MTTRDNDFWDRFDVSDEPVYETAADLAMSSVEAHRQQVHGLPASDDEPRRCDHDTTWSHVDGETFCDACEAVVIPHQEQMDLAAMQDSINRMQERLRQI